jgi:hypothetical protein
VRSRNGLTARGDAGWWQGRSGVKARSRPRTASRARPVGSSLISRNALADAAGDFDADNAFDLAMRVPHDNGLVGAVSVLEGSCATSVSKRSWSQATAGVRGAAGRDSFGSAVESGSR